MSETWRLGLADHALGVQLPTIYRLFDGKQALLADLKAECLPRA